MKFLFLSFIFTMFASNPSFAQHRRHKTFFVNGINAGLYGEIYASVPSASSKSFKMGVQMLRIQDYFALAAGGFYTGGKDDLKRDYSGPLFEAVILPSFWYISGNIAYAMGTGSIENTDEATKETKNRVKFESNDLSFSLMGRVSEWVEITLGYVMQRGETVGADNKEQVNTNSVVLGFRGTLM